MSPPPRHREPTHRSRRLRLPRWALVVACLLACVGLATSAAKNVAWFENNVTRAIDPAGVAAGPSPEPENDPSLASGVTAKVPATNADISQVQGEISPDLSVPRDSGLGRRVVYSEGQQRVWLVGADGIVELTYLVSGSAYDNLEPGSFEVYSRSEQATSFDGASTMAYFVRFTKGPSGAAIGFHDIPISRTDGRPVQSVDELGEPLSHGCIRQLRQDAAALWEFAPLGTSVVVTP